MLKIGIITDQISMDFEYALNIVNDLGLKFIEIHALWNKNIEDIQDEEVKKMKKLIDYYKLQVSNISSTVFLMCHLFPSRKKFTEIDDYFITKEGSYSEHIDFLKRCIVLSHIFQTDKIRIFGFREEVNFNENIIKAIVDRFKEPVRLAEEAGVTLILENCPHTYLKTGTLTRRVVEEIGSENLKLLWDPGNALRSGKSPYPDDYYQAKDYIAHVHIKDLVWDEKSGQYDVHVPIGQGKIDYYGLFQALAKDNYQAVISLEAEYAAKDGTREQASRECFSGIKKILHSLKLDFK